MIPLRDVMPSRTTPVVVLTVIALSAVGSGYETSLERIELERLLAALP